MDIGNTDALQPEETPAESSQQEPQQDSGLQTPQPDQPVPTPEPQPVEETVPETNPENAATAPENVTPPVYPTAEEQEANQLQREKELDAERQRHNERTGGADVQEGAIREEREEHQRRTEGDSAE